MVAGGYPGELPAEAGFALLAEVDGTRAEAESQRAALMEVLGGARSAIDEPPDSTALWRWRDGFNGVVAGVRGAKVSEDVAFPVERLAEGLERFEEIAARHGLRSCAWGHGGDGNVHATVLVDPGRGGRARRGRQAGEELFALVVSLGGSIAAEHGVGRLKRGLLESHWDGGRSSCTSRSSARSTPRDCSTPQEARARASGRRMRRS